MLLRDYRSSGDGARHMQICGKDSLVSGGHLLGLLGIALVPGILTVSVHLLASDNVDAFVRETAQAALADLCANVEEAAPSSSSGSED